MKWKLGYAEAACRQPKIKRHRSCLVQLARIERIIATEKPATDQGTEKRGGASRLRYRLILHSVVHSTSPTEGEDAAKKRNRSPNKTQKVLVESYGDTGEPVM